MEIILDCSRVLNQITIALERRELSPDRGRRDEAEAEVREMETAESEGDP
jgi:hypothetical protein